MSKIKFTFSSSDTPSKEKNYTVGFTPFSSKNLNKVIHQINTHSICPAIFCEKTNATDYRRKYRYHRETINVISIGNIFRLDCDEVGEAKRAIKALRRVGIFALHKPSTNNDGVGPKKHKGHIIVPAKNVSQDIRKYRKQYEYLLKTVLGITLIDNGVQSPVTNMAPRRNEDAVKRTEIIKGKQWVAPNIPDEAPRPERKKLKGKKLKQQGKDVKTKLKSLDPDMKYNQWLNVGFAINSEFGNDGRTLFEDWSSKGGKYEPTYFDKKWINICETNRNEVTIATLFTMNKLGFVVEKEDVFTIQAKTKYCDITVEGFFND